MESVVNYQKVFEKIHKSFNLLEKKEVISVLFNRMNFTEVCKVLGNMTVLDVVRDVEVELLCDFESVTVVFTQKKM